MTTEERHLLRVVSLFLQYPEESWLNSLASLEEVVGEIRNPGAKAVCADFLDHLRNTPLLGLQETYSATFDLNPSTCLDLGYHRWGEGKERGSTLARLVSLYSQAGYELAGGELPDHLPLILEFLSLCSETASFEIIESYAGQVTTLATRLVEHGSPYGGLLRLVSDRFGAPSCQPAGV